MALSGAGAGAFGASGACSGGFWWVGGCAEVCAKSSKPSADADGGQSVGCEWSFPWEAEVLDEAAGEAELGEHGDDEGSPAVGLFWGAERWCGPAEGVLGEAEGVLDVEPAEVGAPASVEVGFVVSGPPQPQRFGGPGGGFGEVFDLDADNAAGHDRCHGVGGPVATPVEFGVEAVPGGHGDGAVAGVVVGERDGRFGPGCRI
mgnify:CR=1 FL=1